MKTYQCDFFRYHNCDNTGFHFFAGYDKENKMILRIFCSTHAEHIRASSNHKDHKELTEEQFEKFSSIT